MNFGIENVLFIYTYLYLYLSIHLSICPSLYLLPISLWSEAPKESNRQHKAVVSGMMRLPGCSISDSEKDEGGRKREVICRLTDVLKLKQILDLARIYKSFRTITSATKADINFPCLAVS